MKESEVWQEATEIWEKREKIKDFNGISVIPIADRSDWLIDIANEYFGNTEQVRRFLDGLE